MGSAHQLLVAHTADLDVATLTAARALLDDAFEDMSDEDWDHGLGGVHALLFEGPELIGHAAVVQRRVLHGSRALRAGYVEGVAVRADRRRRGHGNTLMTAIEGIIRRAYAMGGLCADDDAADFYAARGWQAWRGLACALTPDGVVRTADEDGAIYVLTVSATLDLDAEITCDWRDGDAW